MSAFAEGRASGIFERARIGLVFECYFDDSGKETDVKHDFVVMAGFMSGDWSSLKRSWRSLLLAHGLEQIHMREMVGIAKGKGWTIAELNEVLREFIGAIKESRLVAFGVGVHLPAFRAIPGRRRETLGNAQEFCCSRILRRIMDRLKEAGFGDEPISITFDQDFTYAKERLNMVEELRRRDADLRRTVVQVSFANAAQFYPLQAADMLAWETRRQLANSASGKQSTTRWRDLTEFFPYGEIQYAAGEYWTKDWFDRELPKLARTREG